MTTLRLSMLALLALAATSGCTILTGEGVACRQDRDCPDDVLPFCDSEDGGVGVCTTDDAFEGDFDPDAPDASLLLDAGTDGGADDDDTNPGGAM